MGTTTTSMATSFKVELATATHNFTTTTGQDFRMALVKVSPGRSYDSTTNNYTQLTAATSDEVANGGGYTTGGYDFTAANNITPTSSSTTAFWSWNVNPQWTSATFSTIGCLIYNNTQSTKAVAVYDFGGTQSVSSGTFTVVLPTNNSSNAILRLQ